MCNSRRWLLLTVLSATAAFAQTPGIIGGGILRPVSASSPIVLDGSVHCNGHATPVNTESCALTGVTAGDLITVEFMFQDSGQLSDIADATNGSYPISFLNDNSNVGAWQGQAFFPNSAGGTITPTINIVSSGACCLSISAEAWKNARLSAPLDSATVSQFKIVTTATATPTAGTAHSPTGSGELLIGSVNLNAQTPTAGASYALIDTVASSYLFFPEYRIQTTSTADNCPYVEGTTDEWTDTCSAYLPSSASAGVTPFRGALIDFNSLVNGSAPTATTAGNSGFGLSTNSSGSWAVSNTHSSLFGSTTSLGNLTTPLWINGASRTGSGSSVKFQYTTGTGGDSITVAIGSHASLSALWIFETDLAQNDTSGNAYSAPVQINGVGGTECNPQILPNGTSLDLKEEVNGSLVSPGTINPVSTSTTYLMELQYTPTSCSLALFTYPGLVQVGSTITKTGLTQGAATGVEIGVSGAEAETSAKHLWVSAVKLFQDGGSIPLTF